MLLYTKLISIYIWSRWESFIYPEPEVSSQSAETVLLVTKTIMRYSLISIDIWETTLKWKDCTGNIAHTLDMMPEGAGITCWQTLQQS